MSDWQDVAQSQQYDNEDPRLDRPAIPNEEISAPRTDTMRTGFVPQPGATPVSWPPIPTADHGVPPVNNSPNTRVPYYAQPQQVLQPVGQTSPSLLHRWRAKGGVLGGIATILLLLAKIGGPILALLKFLPFLKVLITAGSMFISIWLWAKMSPYGWAFGAGIVGLIFIHECGHAIAGRMRGIPTGMMVFIPFMGAFVTLKRGGRNIAEDAFIGIMGPIFGTLASLACLGIYFFHPSPFWIYLATIGFFINLFNLAPTAPLDGGWIVPLFSPKLLAVGVVLLVLIGFANPLIWILGILSLPRIIGGWKANTATNPYYQASAGQRWGIGLTYFGLAVFLALAYGFAGGHFPMYHLAM